jgi:hypothetical protein
VRKYYITRNIGSDELMQSICVHIEKAHSENLWRLRTFALQPCYLGRRLTTGQQLL